MKKIGDLMRELGFREDADDELKKAFIRNLVKAAYPSEPNRLRDEISGLEKNEDKQLSFEIESQSPGSLARKSG